MADREKIKFIEKGREIRHEKIYHYDVVILGGGPAGLTAAIYTSRYGMKTVLISKDIGGMANLSHKIENYPGYVGSGFELMQKFYKQTREHGTLALNEDIIELEKDDNGFVIITSPHKIVHAKSIIIALGTKRRKLNIKGEDKFLGKGVSSCVTCDGSFFREKDVAVIGGGNSACIDALIMSGFAKKVYVIYRGDKFRCEDITMQKLQKKKNVEFHYNSIPKEIIGEEVVNELIIDKNGKRKIIKVDGVFIDIGNLPVSDIAKMLKIKMDEGDYIHVNEHMETNVKGVFAAGDVVKSKLKQIVVAAAQGAIAAKSASEYVSSL